MNNEEVEEVIRRVVEKAVENGYRTNITDYQNLSSMDWVYGSHTPLLLMMYHPDHKFAKAVWGEDVGRWREVTEEGRTKITVSYLSDWQYHIQQMVISPDPIAYLVKHNKELK